VTNSGIRVILKPDDNTFNVPKAKYTILLSAQSLPPVPLTRLLCGLAFKTLKDDLNELVYDAELAGLNYSFSYSNTNLPFIKISVSGYTEKLVQFLEFLLSYIKDYKINEGRFEAIREKTYRSYVDWKNAVSGSHARYYLNLERGEFDKLLSYEIMESVFEKNADEVNVENTQTLFEKRINRDNFAVEVVACGSLDLPKVEKSLVGLVENWLGDANTRIIEKSEIPSEKIRVLSESGPFRIVNKNTVQPNGAIVVYHELGVNKIEKLLPAQLLVQMLKSVCFDHLRTKLQLGYSTSCYLDVIGNTHGISVRIQSSKHPKQLEYEVWNWWFKVVKPYMVGICRDGGKSEKFDKFLESFVEKILTKPKNLSADSSNVITEVMKNRYNYEYAEEKAEWCRKKLNRELVYEFFEREIIRSKKVMISQVLGKDMENEYSLNEDNGCSELLKIMKNTKDCVEVTGEFYEETLADARKLKKIGILN